ncbi:MAG TPA: methyltransferase domain-containing protein [Vicinamibacterales bacterium]|nr:methyltransferase domain-containing protein [Vicinamibacterales bacterium]
MGEWNAEAYHRLAEPQLAWARRLLARLALRGDERVADLGCGTGRSTAELAGRLPRGLVVAVDRSATMIARAARELASHPRVHLVRADAAALPFAGAFDVVFSSATFHWIPDHDALFRSIFTALRPGGRLLAQCGGGPNLERLLARAARLATSPPFRAAFTDWVDPWYFATPEETARRLRAAGFTDVDTGLEPAPTSFADAETFRAFLETVCVREYLARLEPEAAERFAHELTAAAADDTPPYTLDYWRLNLSARKPA